MILPHAHVSASELKETFILVVESKHKTPKTAPALFLVMKMLFAVMT